MSATQNGNHTISNLSAGLKGVSLNDQQNSQTNLSLLQQQLESEASQGSLSRISQFFQNQPTEGYTLFSHRSAPNGFKVAIILSELGLQFNTIFLDFNHGEQRAPEFVTINPNARVPALIDHYNDNVAIWESGAIILYLVQRYLRDNGECPLWSNDLVEQTQISSWLFFQTSGHAPMIGQALHFRYFHSCSVPSAVERYTDEVRRVYGVIEMALAERREALIMDLDVENAAAYSAGTTPLSQSRYFDYPVWLVGDSATVADLSFVPWNNVVDRIGISLKTEFPEVYKWTKHMMRRPAVVRALRGD
ncbi:transcriptional regulator Ure2p [Diutina catenulata]